MAVNSNIKSYSYKENIIKYERKIHKRSQTIKKCKTLPYACRNVMTNKTA